MTEIEDVGTLVAQIASRSTRDAAVFALRDRRLEALPHLLDLYDQVGDWETREAAIALAIPLGESNDVVVQWALHALDDRSDKVRVAAVCVLGRSFRQELIGRLESHFDAHDSLSGTAALCAIAAIEQHDPDLVLIYKRLYESSATHVSWSSSSMDMTDEKVMKEHRRRQNNTVRWVKQRLQKAGRSK